MTAAPRYTALVVDDEPENLAILVAALSRAGMRVLVAEDGAAAVELVSAAAAAEQPDVVLLDVLMPGLDGYATARKLRTIAGMGDVPIVFVTALGESRDRVRALAVDAVDFITKPFRSDEVLPRILAYAELRVLRRRLG
jgi:CheY-like chemotaxis protein